uniref:THAP domain-containing protein 1 n=1 Tax=Cyprinus carpio TaxID=7962 RepID=A0A8C1QUH5_CYPCA
PPIWRPLLSAWCYKYNSLLSFHTFPSDVEIRRKRLVAIRRDKFIVTPHTRVCSQHFNKEDVRERVSETGRRLLNKGALPYVSTDALVRFWVKKQTRMDTG